MSSLMNPNKSNAYRASVTKSKTAIGLLAILLVAFLATAGLGSTASGSAASSAASSFFQSWGSWECAEGVCYSWRQSYSNGPWSVRWKSVYGSTVTVDFNVLYSDAVTGRSKRENWNATISPGQIKEFYASWYANYEPDIEVNSVR